MTPIGKIENSKGTVRVVLDKRFAAGPKQI